MRHILIPIIISLLFVPLFLHAQETFPLLVSDLPFIGSTTNLAELLKGIFRLTLGIAITATVFIIVFNGIKYMASDAIGKKEDAIAWIKEALWGLLLAFSVVLILNTINPNLTQFDFLTSLRSLRTIPTTQPPGDDGGGGEEPPTTDPAEADLRARLRAAGIAVNKPACTTPGQTNCTNVAGLPESAISGLIALHDACACGGFTLTGGTEAGHDTHGVGLPMLDLSRGSNVTRFLLQNASPVRNTCLGQLYSYGGSEFLDETGGAPHWHACFGTSCGFRPGC